MFGGQNQRQGMVATPSEPPPNFNQMPMHSRQPTTPGQFAPQQLVELIQDWNDSRYDMFHISYPDESGIFKGVIRFFYYEHGAKAATKCLRVTNHMTSQQVVEELVEKFRPDMKMLSAGRYVLCEAFGDGQWRQLEDHEIPLLVQLSWSSDVKEGRLILKEENERNVDQHRQMIPAGSQRLSKRDKKKLQQKQNAGKENKQPSTVAERAFNELPDQSFTRSISNPEAVMKRRRQQKIAQLNQIENQEGGGNIMRIFGSILDPSVPYKSLVLSRSDTALMIVREMLSKYRVPNCAHPDVIAQYCLVMIRQERNPNNPDEFKTSENVLNDEDSPIVITKTLPPGQLRFEVQRRDAVGQTAGPRGSIAPAPAQMARQQSADSQQFVSSNVPPPALVEQIDSGTEKENGLIIQLTEPLLELGSGSHALAPGAVFQFLPAPDLEKIHAVINITSFDNPKTVILSPTTDEANVFVDNQRIFAPTQLTNGQRIRFGHNTFFRYCDPSARPLPQAQHQPVHQAQQPFAGSFPPQVQPQAMNQSAGRSMSPPPQRVSQQPVNHQVAPQPATRPPPTHRAPPGAVRVLPPQTSAPTLPQPQPPLRQTTVSPPPPTVVPRQEHQPVPRAQTLPRESPRQSAVNTTTQSLSGTGSSSDSLLPVVMKALNPNNYQFPFQAVEMLTQKLPKCFDAPLVPLLTIYTASKAVDDDNQLSQFLHSSADMLLNGYFQQLQQNNATIPTRMTLSALLLSTSSQWLYVCDRDSQLRGALRATESANEKLDELVFCSATTICNQAILDLSRVLIPSIFAAPRHQSQQLPLPTEEDEAAVIEDVMQLFSGLLDVLFKFHIHQTVVTQLFGHLLAYTNAVIFNHFMTHSELRMSRSACAIVLYPRLRALRKFLSDRGFEAVAATVLSPAIEAAALLDRDIKPNAQNSVHDLASYVHSNCRSLTTGQIKALLAANVPADWRPPPQAQTGGKPIDPPRLPGAFINDVFTQLGPQRPAPRPLPHHAQTQLEPYRLANPLALPNGGGFEIERLARGPHAPLGTFFYQNLSHLVKLQPNNASNSGRWDAHFDGGSGVAPRVIKPFQLSLEDPLIDANAGTVEQRTQQLASATASVPMYDRFLDDILGQQVSLQRSQGASSAGSLSPRPDQQPQQAPPRQQQAPQQQQHHSTPPRRPDPINDDAKEILFEKVNNSMGLSIVAATPANAPPGIYISLVQPNGAAARDGRLETGDQILAVDGRSLVGVDQETAAAHLKRTNQTVRLALLKRAAEKHGLAPLLQQQMQQQQPPQVPQQQPQPAFQPPMQQQQHPREMQGYNSLPRRDIASPTGGRQSQHVQWAPTPQQEDPNRTSAAPSQRTSYLASMNDDPVADDIPHYREPSNAPRGSYHEPVQAPRGSYHEPEPRGSYHEAMRNSYHSQSPVGASPVDDRQYRPSVHQAAPPANQRVSPVQRDSYAPQQVLPSVRPTAGKKASLSYENDADFNAMPPTQQQLPVSQNYGFDQPQHREHQYPGDRAPQQQPVRIPSMGGVYEPAQESAPSGGPRVLTVRPELAQRDFFSAATTQPSQWPKSDEGDRFGQSVMRQVATQPGVHDASFRSSDSSGHSTGGAPYHQPPQTSFGRYGAPVVDVDAQATQPNFFQTPASTAYQRPTAASPVRSHNAPPTSYTQPIPGPTLAQSGPPPTKPKPALAPKPPPMAPKPFSRLPTTAPPPLTSSAMVVKATPIETMDTMRREALDRANDDDGLFHLPKTIPTLSAASHTTAKVQQHRPRRSPSPPDLPNMPPPLDESTDSRRSDDSGEHRPGGYRSGVVGANEVYRDPRERILASRREETRTTTTTMMSASYSAASGSAYKPTSSPPRRYSPPTSYQRREEEVRQQPVQVSPERQYQMFSVPAADQTGPQVLHDAQSKLSFKDKISMFKTQAGQPQQASLYSKPTPLSRY